MVVEVGKFKDEDDTHSAVQIISAALKQISANVKAWDREDVSDLIKILHPYEKLKQTYRHYFKNIDSDEDAVWLAIQEISEHNSQPWPEPGDNELCEFAILCDNNGGFLGNPDSNELCDGSYWIGEWEVDSNCCFAASDEA